MKKYKPNNFEEDLKNLRKRMEEEQNEKYRDRKEKIEKTFAKPFAFEREKNLKLFYEVN